MNDIWLVLIEIIILLIGLKSLIYPSRKGLLGNNLDKSGVIIVRILGGATAVLMLSALLYNF